MILFYSVIFKLFISEIVAFFIGFYNFCNFFITYVVQSEFVFYYLHLYCHIVNLSVICKHWEKKEVWLIAQFAEEQTWWIRQLMLENY